MTVTLSGATITADLPLKRGNPPMFHRLLLAICALVAVQGQVHSVEPRPLVVAHRGLLRHAPENTYANFRACLELRLGFEFDVERTSDGHLVCIHDDTVNRTTNGKGNSMDQKTVKRLERELVKAITEVVITRNKNWKYPLLPPQITLEQMASAAAAVYEAAVDDSKSDEPDQGRIAE